MKKSFSTLLAAVTAFSALGSLPVTAAESDYLLHSTFEESA